MFGTKTKAQKKECTKEGYGRKNKYNKRLSFGLGDLSLTSQPLLPAGSICQGRNRLAQSIKLDKLGMNSGKIFCFSPQTFQQTKLIRSTSSYNL